MKLRALGLVALAGGCTSILGLGEDRYVQPFQATCDLYASLCRQELASGVTCALGVGPTDCKTFLGSKPAVTPDDDAACLGAKSCAELVTCTKQRFALPPCDELLGTWRALFYGTFTFVTPSTQSPLQFGAGATFVFGGNCKAETFALTFQDPANSGACPAAPVKACGATFDVAQGSCTFKNLYKGTTVNQTHVGGGSGTVSGNSLVMKVSGTFSRQDGASGTFIGTWTATRM